MKIKNKELDQQYDMVRVDETVVTLERAHEQHKNLLHIIGGFFRRKYTNVMKSLGRGNKQAHEIDPVDYLTEGEIDRMVQVGIGDDEVNEILEFGYMRARGEVLPKDASDVELAAAIELLEPSESISVEKDDKKKSLSGVAAEWARVAREMKEMDVARRERELQKGSKMGKILKFAHKRVRDVFKKGDTHLQLVADTSTVEKEGSQQITTLKALGKIPSDKIDLFFTDEVYHTLSSDKDFPAYCAKHDMVDKFLKFYVQHQGINSDKVCAAVIQGGQGETLMKYLPEFPEYNKTNVLIELCKAGLTALVIKYRESFDNLSDKRFMNLITEHGTLGDLLLTKTGREYFTKTGFEVLDYVKEHGGLKQLILALEDYPNLSQSDVADFAIESDNGLLLAKYLNKFDSLDKHVYFEKIARHNSLVSMAPYWENYTADDANTCAEAAMDGGLVMYQLMMNYVSTLDADRQSELMLKLGETKNYNLIKNIISVFSHLNAEASKVYYEACTGNARAFYRYIDIFDQVDIEVARDLKEKGFKKKMRANMDRFPEEFQKKYSSAA